MCRWRTGRHYPDDCTARGQVKHGLSWEDATESRSHLAAFLSRDGECWSAGLLLDEREKVSYPDVAQAPNGAGRSAPRPAPRCYS